MAAIVKPHKITEPLRADDIDDNFDRIFRLLASSVASVGILPAPSGGTGIGTYTIGDLLVANTPTSLDTIHAVAAGNALISAGVGTIPVWGKIGLTHLAALTTKGDLLTHDGTTHVRLPVGTNGFALLADDADVNGVKWKRIPGSALQARFLRDDASDIAGYRQLLAAHDSGADTIYTFAALAIGDTLLDEWATNAGDPLLDFFTDGVWHLHIHAQQTGGTRLTHLWWEGYKRTAGGTETLIVTSEHSEAVTGAETEFDIDVAAAEIDIDPTDRVVIKLYAHVHAGGSAPTIDIHIEGDTSARIEYPISASSGGLNTHDLLDATTHTDTLTGSPIRGDLVAALSPAEDGPYWLDGAVLSELDNGNNYGEEAYWLDGEATGGIGFSADAGSKWQRFPIGPAGTSLQSNGLTLLWGSTTPTAPRVKVGLSANFDLASGAVGPYTPGGTVVPLDELIFDSHGFWNPTVNPERFTVPAGLGGVYIIAGQIGYDVIAAGRRAAWIFKNGARRGIAENAGDDSGLGMSFTVVTFLELAAGDYIELVARQDSGGTVAVLGTANAEFSHLQMARISL